MWVTTAALATLNREHFRAADPIRLFPAVETGRLMPQSLDTAAFQALERCMERLTGNSRLSHAERASELLAVWRGLEAEYPAAMFKN
jgi:hypothetical protein